MLNFLKVVRSIFLLPHIATIKTKNTAADTADDMCWFRYLIGLDTIDKFFTQKKNSYQNESYGYFTGFDIGEGD